MQNVKWISATPTLGICLTKAGKAEAAAAAGMAAEAAEARATQASTKGS